MVARYFHYRPFSHPRNDGRDLTLNGKRREKSLGIGRNNAIKRWPDYSVLINLATLNLNLGYFGDEFCMDRMHFKSSKEGK